MDMLLFAKRLKSVRVERHISAVELAKAIKVNATTIHRYEKADFKSIKEDRLEAIAECLMVDKNYLIGKTDDQYNVETLAALHKQHNVELSTVIYVTKKLVNNDNVTLNGKPVNRDSLEYLIDSIELALELLKRKNGN